MLTWIQGKDFNSWWFEDENQNRVGYVVKEEPLYVVYDADGGVVEEFGNLDTAKTFVEDAVKSKLRQSRGLS